MNKKRPVLCLQLLKTFSNDELEGLGKILSCEYFNTDRWVKKLLKVMKKYVLKSGTFDDEMQCIIYREVFDHLPTPDGALTKNERSWFNQKLNELMRLAELFLSIQQVKQNDDHRSDLLYPELLMRKQYQSFNRHIKKDKATLDQSGNKGAEYYTQKYKIEKAILNYLHQSGKLMKEDNLPELIENLDLYYALEKLDLHITALSMSYAPGTEEYDLSSMGATTPLLDLPQYIQNPLIVLYRANIALIKTESETAYSDLLSHLNQYESVVPNDILKGFYTSGANYCAGQIKRGRLEYNRKMYELYKVMDDKNLLINKGIISVVKLKNIIIMGCRVGEYDWAVEIIERYLPHIRQDIRDSVYYFNLGTIAFYQKDYATAHSRFIQVGKVNRNYDNNVRIFIIKCLYETEKDPMSYDYMIRNFRSTERFFKGTSSLPQKDKKSYVNFIKVITLLYKVRHNINATQTDTERISKKLDAQKLNSDKRWLAEKIEELERKIK